MKKRPAKKSAQSEDYSCLGGNIGELLETARRSRSSKALELVHTEALREALES